MVGTPVFLPLRLSALVAVIVALVIACSDADSDRSLGVRPPADAPTNDDGNPTDDGGLTDDGDGGLTGDSDANPVGAQPDAFSLTIPKDRWKASAYCGPVTPPLPANPTPPYRFETELLDSKLAGDGLIGWIHGAVPSYQQYVFTYRKEDPNDFMAFFKTEQMSLVPGSADIAQTLATLKRHDKVKLKGKVMANGSPVTHLVVTSLEIVKRFEGATDNSYRFDLARLEGAKTFHVFGQVHATTFSEKYGRAIVVEHDDIMLPLAVPAKHDAAAAPLYRGDIVDVAVRVIETPRGPPHLSLDPEVDQAVEVIDPILNCHGLETTVTGYLTKFEKSPAISVDVYAVRVVDANGIGRNYTLFPDVENDPATDENEFLELFFGLSAKAKKAWDDSSAEPTVVRNYRAKAGIKVTVKGRINVVSTEQANAQVYVKSVGDLSITAAE